VLSYFLEAQLTVEKISAVTLRVANMWISVRFYRDVLGLEIIYGGEDADFSSLRTKEGKSPILNLERSNPATQWGRLILMHSGRI
jgi:catechol 2,3-dioxygenase-like lactoylglutathione lyase family enzyme